MFVLSDILWLKVIIAMMLLCDNTHPRTDTNYIRTHVLTQTQTHLRTHAYIYCLRSISKHMYILFMLVLQVRLEEDSHSVADGRSEDLR